MPIGRAHAVSRAPFLSPGLQSDQPVRDANGNFRPAEDMEFFHSESDETPFPSSRGLTHQRQTDRHASVLRNELLEAHRKLSGYYYKFDQSPYYGPPFLTRESRMMDFALISKSATDRLDHHFRLYYVDKTPARAPNLREPSASQQKGSPQKDFAARYRVKDRTVIDEL
ncbi:hypothetical protein C8R44DRAFT_867458 [Mycena epipterygia]|nr:hypothetical protein C8R44DRAFT_867458 [Mycena epipterygia]